MYKTNGQNANGDNKIGLKSVGELCGMNFYIPNYQRGYRWTEQQVSDLLNDINEFEGNDGFYCLQPLVVKQREKDLFKKIKEEAKDINEVYNFLKGSWEVIDGQQRLTTIFIIMGCLGITHRYSLEYETREGSANFLNGVSEEKEDDNIDYYHISNAKKTIEEWFKDKDSNFRNQFQDKLLKNVDFIWYESVDEDPIKVFTRLNIGKVSLTNSELIKALFLNRSNFNTKENEYIKLCQQEIATEWDKIEYSLQNDEFWLFLHEKGYNHPTRIDFIFDLICQADLKLFCKIDKKKIGTDEYKTFRYFHEYFRTEDSDIVMCWKVVKKYYQTFKEWYDDLELFHYIGYLIECKQNSISVLINKWNDGQTDKKSFCLYLRNEVKKVIGSCPKLDAQYKEDGSDKRECKRILLFHNIQTVINQNITQQNNEKYKRGSFYKFPFHLYKLESWDVEHINSSTTNSEEDEDTQQEWLLNIYLSVNEELQKKIKKYFDLSANKEKEREKEKLFKEIKKEFEGKSQNHEEWSQEDKNKIWNYTLLDSSTNRSYGNAIFSGKRRVIIGKEKGKLISVPKLKNGKLEMTDEQESASSFVPPCTKQIYLKYYSAIVGDNNYWTKEDAQSYLNDIEHCIKKLEE